MITAQGTLLAVGEIVKAFGVRGDLVVRPLTDIPARFRSLTEAFLGSDEHSVRPVTVERVQVERRGARLKLQGVDDRDAAEELVGQLLFVDERNKVHLPKGTYFVHDVIGLQAVDPEGAPLGIVRDVLKMPANDVYVIGNGTRNLLVPAVKEFILGIDIRAGVMRVKIIEGMVEE